MAVYELTKHADIDLQGIARDTIAELGAERASAYFDKLRQLFQKIATNKAKRKEFSVRLPFVFVTRWESYYLFYICRGANPPRIFAVFHEHMDQLKRLQNRLL